MNVNNLDSNYDELLPYINEIENDEDIKNERLKRKRKDKDF